jgi:hypothetical protein
MQHLKNQYCSNCKRKKLEDRVPRINPPRRTDSHEFPFKTNLTTRGHVMKYGPAVMSASRIDGMVEVWVTTAECLLSRDGTVSIRRNPFSATDMLLDK